MSDLYSLLQYLISIYKQVEANPVGSNLIAGILYALLLFLLGFLWRWHIDLIKFFKKIWKRICESEKHVLSSTSSSVHLGNIDTGVVLIAGCEDEAIRLDFIECKISQNRSRNDPHFTSESHKDAAKKCADKMRKNDISNSNISEKALWDSDFAYIQSFSEKRSSNDDIKLTIQYGVTGYYDFYCTTCKFQNHFEDQYKKHIDAAPAMATGTLDQFVNTLHQQVGIEEEFDWQNTLIPNLVNGLALNIHIFTDDNKFIVCRRGHHCAIAPNVCAAAINENPDPNRIINDFIDDRLHFENIFKRALKSEAKLEEEFAPFGNFLIHLFSVDKLSLSYGLICSVSIDKSASDILSHINNCRPKDSFEAKGFEAHNITDLVKFIHDEHLYNSVGVGLIYSAINRKLITRSKVNDDFKKLQR